MTQPTTHTFSFKGDDYIIMVGKDQNDNDRKIDESEPTDIWFHVANAPSSHVFLKPPAPTPLNKLPKQVLTRCACLCKANSQSKSQKKCEINYTQVGNLEKTPTPGRVSFKDQTSTALKSITI